MATLRNPLKCAFLSFIVLAFTFPVPGLGFADDTTNPSFGSTFSPMAGAESNRNRSAFSNRAGSESANELDGEITKVTGNTYVLKDRSGKEITVTATSSTTLNGSPQIGDHIQV
ncbi:MAG: hypothetical protein ABJB49_07145, partial [Nitrospirota bacterium]